MPTFALAFQAYRLTILEAIKGEMVEWSITTVLKTVVPRGTGGSNPSLSAINLDNQGFTKNVHDLYTKTPDFARISGVFSCYPQPIFHRKDF